MGKRHRRLTPPPKPPPTRRMSLSCREFCASKLGRVSCTKCNLTRTPPVRLWRQPPHRGGRKGGFRTWLAEIRGGGRAGRRGGRGPASSLERRTSRARRRVRSLSWKRASRAVAGAAGGAGGSWGSGGGGGSAGGGSGRRGPAGWGTRARGLHFLGPADGLLLHAAQIVFRHGIPPLQQACGQAGKQAALL